MERRAALQEADSLCKQIIAELPEGLAVPPKDMEPIVHNWFEAVYNALGEIYNSGLEVGAGLARTKPIGEDAEYDGLMMVIEGHIKGAREVHEEYDY